MTCGRPKRGVWQTVEGMWLKTHRWERAGVRTLAVRCRKCVVPFVLLPREYLNGMPEVQYYQRVHNLEHVRKRHFREVVSRALAVARLAVGLLGLWGGTALAHDAPLDAYGCHPTALSTDGGTRECHADLLKGQTFKNLQAELTAYISAQKKQFSDLTAQAVALEKQVKALTAQLDALVPAVTVALTGVESGETIPCKAGTTRALMAKSTGAVKAEFYSGTELMITDATDPYGMDWNLDCRWTVPGPVTLKAVATGPSGKKAESSVSVTIIPPPPPTVSLERGQVIWEWAKCDPWCGGEASSFTITCPGHAPVTVTDSAARSLALKAVAVPGTYACQATATSAYPEGDQTSEARISDPVTAIMGP